MLKDGAVCSGELPNGVDTGLVKYLLRHPSHTPDQSHRQRVEERSLVFRFDHDQTVRLGDLRCHFCQVLGSSNADRHRQANLVPNPFSDTDGDGAWGAKQMDRSRDIKESLVDRDPFNKWREVVEHCHNRIAQTLIFMEVSGDELDRWAKLPGPPARHAASDPVCPCLIGSGKDHASTNSDRLARQRGVEELLDRRVKRVQVGVENRR
jgi:hypothetical protein